MIQYPMLILPIFITVLLFSQLLQYLVNKLSLFILPSHLILSLRAVYVPVKEGAVWGRKGAPDPPLSSPWTRAVTAPQGPCLLWAWKGQKGSRVCVGLVGPIHNNRFYMASHLSATRYHRHSWMYMHCDVCILFWIFLYLKISSTWQCLSLALCSLQNSNYITLFFTYSLSLCYIFIAPAGVSSSSSTSSEWCQVWGWRSGVVQGGNVSLVALHGFKWSAAWGSYQN